MPFEPMLSISIEDPGGIDAGRLLDQSDLHSASVYPPESRHQADLAVLRAPNVRFFVARIDRAAVG